MRDDREWSGLTPNLFSNKTGYNEVKIMGHKNEGQVLKEIREEYASHWLNFNFKNAGMQELTDVYFEISKCYKNFTR